MVKNGVLWEYPAGLDPLHMGSMDVDDATSGIEHKGNTLESAIRRAFVPVLIGKLMNSIYARSSRHVWIGTGQRLTAITDSTRFAAAITPSRVVRNRKYARCGREQTTNWLRYAIRRRFVQALIGTLMRYAANPIGMKFRHISNWLNYLPHARQDFSESPLDSSRAYGAGFRILCDSGYLNPYVVVNKSGNIASQRFVSDSFSRCSRVRKGASTMALDAL